MKLAVLEMPVGELANDSHAWKARMFFLIEETYGKAWAEAGKYYLNNKLATFDQIIRAIEKAVVSFDCTKTTIKTWLRWQVLGIRQSDYKSGRVMVVGKGRLSGSIRAEQAREETQTVSLNQTISDDDGNEVEQQDFVKSETLNPAEATDRILEMERIEKLLTRLSKTEKTVIQLAFGLNGEEEKSIAEIASILGLTKQAVYQAQDRAIRKLRLAS